MVAEIETNANSDGSRGVARSVSLADAVCFRVLLPAHFISQAGRLWDAGAACELLSVLCELARRGCYDVSPVIVAAPGNVTGEAVSLLALVHLAKSQRKRHEENEPSHAARSRLIAMNEKKFQRRH